ncbi:MAG TPA: hypothetical protein VFB32_15675 [Rudaea sp.]|nr:hypothetical protein [Rudaea sp.]
MRTASFAFVLLAAFGSTAYANDIFRCVGPNGDVMFTNMACAAGSKAERVASYTPVPDAPVPEYSKPTFEPQVSAAPSAAQAQAAYQAGYAQAQEDAQEQRREEPDYDGGWIPYYPVRRGGNRGHHHPPHKAMAVQTPVRSRWLAIRPNR